jgi:tRNA 2-thiouridine synthesizing protein A
LATEIDTTGLKCPLPVLKAKKAMKALAPGDEIRVLATDPDAPADFEAFCREAGHALLERWEDDGVFGLRIRKGGPA